MKKFLILGFTVFATLFLAVACDDDKDDDYDQYCVDVCKEETGGSTAECRKKCPKSAFNTLNEYLSECINAGHSASDCETWYYED